MEFALLMNVVCFLLGFALFPVAIAVALRLQNMALIKVEKQFKKAADAEPAHDPTLSS
jgi:hypothetical protein